MNEDFDWKTAFELAAAQRDEATRNLCNLQIELALARKKISELTKESES